MTYAPWHSAREHVAMRVRSFAALAPIGTTSARLALARERMAEIRHATHSHDARVATIAALLKR
jgi:hypothetical protein